MTRSAGAIALVESPVQLLHVLEWRHCRGPERTRIVVLAPLEPTGRRQLRSMVGLALDSGAEVIWMEPRSSRTAFLRVRRQLRGWMSTSPEVVLGDPFSGVIQSVLPGAAKNRVTVIDDGTATIDFTDLLRSGEPLLRWTSRPRHRGRLFRVSLGARASRFFVDEHRQVDLFTVMPVEARPGVSIIRHDYAWTRQRFGPPQVDPGAVVVGSSLVESGVLHEESYLAAVASAVPTDGEPAGRYLAHRRESTRKLRTLAERTGLKVIHSPVPLEIELRSGPVGRRVICFPSTPAFTLPFILNGTGVSIEVLAIEDSWVREDASDRAKAFLTRLAGHNGGTH